MKGAFDDSGLIHLVFTPLAGLYNDTLVSSSYLDVSPSRLVLDVVGGTDLTFGLHLHFLVEYLIVSSPCEC